MKYLRIVCFFGLALSFLPHVAHAQYAALKDPKLEREMSESMLYPTALVCLESNVSGVSGCGSSTVVFSGELDVAKICKIEGSVLKDDPMCSQTTDKKQFRTYLLTNYHNFVAVPERQLPNDPHVALPDINPDTFRAGIIFRMTSQNMQGARRSRPLPATVVVYEKEKDLAVVRIDGYNEAFPYVAKMAPKNVDLGLSRKVWSVGYPHEYGPLMTEGELSGLEQVCETSTSGRLCQTLFLSSTALDAGNSGGGLYQYSPKRGFELIGVPRLVGSIPQVSLSIMIQHVHLFLEAHNLDFIIPSN